jgi:hypothetical protein
MMTAGQRTQLARAMLVAQALNPREDRLDTTTVVTILQRRLAVSRATAYRYLAAYDRELDR